MGGIFISYRRGDSGPYAGRLRDALSNHFGAEHVFRDVDTINPGERFPRVIEQAVGSCDALLGLIGPAWLSIKDGAGRRRLDDPEDYVRLEIAAALGRGDDVLVIPVLVGGASMPAAADLPKPLASLAERNALPFPDESWDAQVARLNRELEKVVQRPVVPSPPQVAVPQAEVTATVKVGARAGWLRRKMWPELSRAALISYADHLAEAVDLRETGLLDQLRGGPDTVMDLEFQAARFRSADGDAFGVLSNIGPYFRRQASPRRLLVVGEAGAGKTVLAVHLLLDQLRDRAVLTDNLRIDTPVPVRVNIAGWDGGGDFTSWMASQLGTDYGLNQKVALALTDAGYILPVLDGLDEMDPPDAEPERARVALERLNEPPWRNRTVVVMCRAGVYDRLRELRGDAGLHGATTITLQPLSSIEICDYLHHYREQLGIPNDAWVPVTEQIGHDPDGPLATALRTPWLLGLAATSLRRDRRTATQLAACRDSTEIRDLLFAALIPAAIQGMHRTGPTRDYTEQKVQTWMHTLAQHLERPRALEDKRIVIETKASYADKLGWWLGGGTAQPDGETLAQHLESRRGKVTRGTEITLDQIWALAGTRRFRALNALTAGLFAGLPTGLFAGLTAGPTAVLFAGLPYGLTAGVLNLLPGRLEATASAERFAWHVPGRSRWRKGLMVGLGAALLFAVYGFIVGIPKLGLVVGPILLGPVFGFWYVLQTNPEDRLALGQEARRIMHYDLVARLAYGLAFGLAFGLLFGLTGGPFAGLTAGLAFGLAYGLGSGATWPYATASLLFAFTGIFAPRPAQFLEWARNAGLLRVTGIAYQFRHDSYQQWLAAGDVDRGVKTTLDAQDD